MHSSEVVRAISLFCSKLKARAETGVATCSGGEGVIRCDNGQSMPVAINVEGGGITFGKTEVKNATGKFSEVSKIDDLLGAYAAAEAEAGAVKSAEAQALTKGEVSLALAGTGSGWSIGVSGAKFKITRRKK